jgi:hypothetical protein
MEPEPDRRWHWRNCRNFSVALRFVVYPWRLAVWREDDVYGGGRGFQIGPLLVSIDYSCGDPNDLFGMSELEAWENASRWEGVDP